MVTNIPATYDKELTCPMCEHTFTSKKLRSRSIRVEKIENDFYTVYKNPLHNPTLYEVFVCETCGYAFTDQFHHKVTENIKERFMKKVTASWVPRSYGGERTYEEAIVTYKLALISGKITEQKLIVMAGICLRLSWLYRYLENEEEEKKFLKHAAKYYESSYIEGDFKGTSMTEIRLLFLLGELNRKLEKTDKAIIYFSEVIQHKDRHLEPSIVDRAREQWQLIREKRND